jgi:hypothetical protein
MAIFYVLVQWAATLASLSEVVVVGDVLGAHVAK